MVKIQVDLMESEKMKVKGQNFGTLKKHPNRPQH